MDLGVFKKVNRPRISLEIQRPVFNPTINNLHPIRQKSFVALGYCLNDLLNLAGAAGLHSAGYWPA